MPTDKENPIILCQDMLVRLSRDLEFSDGTIVSKGTQVLLLPQTIADCVLTPDGESLAHVWESISRSGHTHPEIAAFSEQLTRYADRLAAVETGLATVEAEIAQMPVNQTANQTEEPAED